MFKYQICIKRILNKLKFYVKVLISLMCYKQLIIFQST